MKSWIESLGSTVFVVLLMTSMLAVLIPSVTSSVTGTQEAPIILSSTTFKLYSTDDTGVQEGIYENNNYGLIYNMYNGWNPNGAERTWIKFDLSSITLGSIIENATLWLLAKHGPSSGPPNYPSTWHLIDALGSDNDNWTETTITWDNAPTFADNVYDTENFIAKGLIAGSARAGDNLELDGEMVWYPWNVTSFIAAESAGNRLATIVLRGRNEFDNKHSAGWFYARNEPDNVDRLPYLEVTFSPPSWGAVTVVIAPNSKDGLRGSEPSFTVDVINMGGITDNYRMTLGDDAGWVLTLSDNLVGPDNRLENMAPGETRTVTLTVKVPDDAPIGTQDNVWVNATAVDNENITSTANVTVICTDKIDVRADSWVSDGIPNEDTYGTSPLRLASFTQGDNRNCRTFLKFPLEAIPDGKNIESAKVWLHVSGAYADDLDAQIFGVNDDWEDKSITWNNQPPHGDALDTQTLTSWPENMEDTWISWEVGDFVTGQRYYGDNTASFLIKAEVENTSGSYVFFSMTWTAVELRPKLVITFGAVQRSVSVSISPVHRIGNPYDTVTYDVKVMNKGNVTDNYTLENSDDQGWTMTLTPDSFENVLPGESRTATLSVTLPSTQGAEDNIQVTATGTGVDGSENCTASVKRAGGWEVAGYAPRIDNYGVAVTGVGSGSYIYVANSNALGTRVNLMRYNTDTGEWEYLATPAISTPFKNGTVLAWDGGDYIYALLGGSYADNAENQRARHYFYRYKISTNEWDNLMPTGNTDDNATDTGSQGAGDAMVIDKDESKIYAIVGDGVKGSTFWEYDIATNNWSQLTLSWASTDDGASLVWTGGDSLYALRGEWQETTPDKSFSRYSISFNTWTPRTDIPEPGGVGDGASLVWIDGDNIYATGGSAATEGLDDNFYAYSISGNSWTQLEDLPAGIGAQNGPRLGAGSDIYAWRGSEEDPVLWVYTLEIPSWTGTAVFSLLNLYTVNVEKILNLYQGSKLVVKFYTHGEGYENENVIETFTAPPLWHVEENESARHPGIDGKRQGVSKARLDLTTNDTSNAIETIESFTVHKVHLETRFMDIPFWWSQADAAGKVELETEFMAIPFYWSQAPS